MEKKKKKKITIRMRRIWIIMFGYNWMIVFLALYLDSYCVVHGFQVSIRSVNNNNNNNNNCWKSNKMMMMMGWKDHERKIRLWAMNDVKRSEKRSRQLLKVRSTELNASSTNRDSLKEVKDGTKAASEGVERYEWTKETLQIGVPALIGMMADPLLSTIDTGFVGRLGAIELASLGACTSIFHLAFNSFRSTTAATTSLVATALCKNKDGDQQEATSTILTSMRIGLAIGLAVMNLLCFGSKFILKAMGIAHTSPLFPFASNYLQIRALAAPAVLSIMVAEGAFRGYGDTQIPLFASIFAALINLVLDPILMFTFNMGVSGAAAATAISQFGAAIVYIVFLRKKNMLPNSPRQNSFLPSNKRQNGNNKQIGMAIFRANIAMLGKQGSLLLAWAYATARATRIGHDHVAAHQVALSFWLIFAFLLDGAAVSAQVLMSRSFGAFIVNNQQNQNTHNTNTNDSPDNKNNSNNNGSFLDSNNNESMQAESTNALLQRRTPMRSLVLYMLKLSLVQGLAATGLILFSGAFFSSVFTHDPNIQSHLTALIPHLAWQQVLISLTLVAEGLAVGGSKFNILAMGTTVSTVAAVIAIKNSTNIVQIWSHGIVTLFVGRFITATIGVLDILGARNFFYKIKRSKLSPTKTATV